MTSEVQEPTPSSVIFDETEIHVSSAGRASLETLARLYRAAGRQEDAAQIEAAIEHGRTLPFRA